jgi:hypothetical protein
MIIRAALFEPDPPTNSGVFVIFKDGRVLGLLRYRPFGGPFKLAQVDRLIELYEVQVRAA